MRPVRELLGARPAGLGEWVVRGMRRVAAAAVAGGLLLVAGCTGGGDDAGQADGSSAPTSEAPAAQLAISIADGSADLSPTVPLELTVTDGELGDVTVTDASGAAVAGTVAAAPAAPASPTSSAPSSTTSAPTSGSSASGSSAAGSSASGSGSAASTSDDAAAEAVTSVWTPSTPLAYGGTYTITAAATNADDESTEATSTFSTVTPASVTTPSIGPLDGTTVGVGMPIRVFFDQPVTDQATVESHLVVTSSTPTDGVWSWVSASEVHFRPSTYWPANTQVTLDADLYGVDTGDGIWGEKDRSVTFTVGARHVSVADAATHTMTVYDGDQVVQTWPMSAGSNANPTHNGAHVVLEKFADITMDSSTFGLAVDAPGGYRTDVEFATRISNNGEFVHAAPWSVGQQGSSNVSHGCINLSTDRAHWFYDFSQPGDVVEVVNSIGGTLSASDGDIYDWAVPWDQWVAGSALN